jgi:hypothetical protein
MTALASVALALPAAWARHADHHAGEIRLDSPGGSMEHVEVHNQGGIGACYAHVAAQIYDAWRFSHGDRRYGLQSSGFELNQRYKIYRDDDDIDAGRLEEVFPTLNQEGSCAQAQMNALFKHLTVDQYATRVMGIYYGKHASYRKKIKGYRDRFEHSIDHQPLDQDETRVDLRPVFYAGDQALKRRLLWEGIQELIRLNQNELKNPIPNETFSRLEPGSDTVSVFETLHLVRCPRRDRITLQDRLEFAHSSFHDFPYFMRDPIETVHDELDRGIREALPVGIGYYSSVLKLGRSFLTEPPSARETARHASLIIGRRTHPQTFERQLLIRNSWGKSCSGYSKDWECDKNAGSVWVDEAVLDRAIYEISRIKIRPHSPVSPATRAKELE